MTLQIITLAFAIIVILAQWYCIEIFKTLCKNKDRRIKFLTETIAENACNRLKAIQKHQSEQELEEHANQIKHDEMA